MPRTEFYKRGISPEKTRFYHAINTQERFRMKNCKELLAENQAWIEDIFAKIDAKMSKVTLRSSNKLVDGVDENGVHREIFSYGWTSGFWGGLNYLLYSYTKNEDYLKTAKNCEVLMDDALRNHFEKLHHDVGFQWHICSGAGYRLTGDLASKARNFYAATMLSSRYVPSGKFIRAWNGTWSGLETGGLTIIDCLMNIPLLYWASREFGDDRFKQIAMAHADMALRDHLRPDGSVNHIVEHDRETGEMIKAYGGQGYGEGSSWSRGQSWAVYGLALSYIHTGEVRYLDGAKRVAHYFIANCCDDWLPRCDFRAPSEPVYYDATAGACTACGLIEIAKAVGENEGGIYMNAAINILKAMAEKFLNLDPERDDLLDYGTSSYPTCGRAVKLHENITYGDYFYVEAILKLLGSDFLAW